MKQSQICPKCISWMDLVERNQWLKCRSCGLMVKVVKDLKQRKKRCKE